MTDLTIQAKVIWEEVQTDLSKCEACKEVIYSNMFIPSVYIGNEKFEIGESKYCESCKASIED